MTKFKSLNSTQKQALGWAKARGGKIRLFGRDVWKPGLDKYEPRTIGRNTVVSLLRRGLLKETGWKGSVPIECEVVPEGEAVVPETIGLEMKASLPGVFLNRS